MKGREVLGWSLVLGLLALGCGVAKIEGGSPLERSSDADDPTLGCGEGQTRCGDVCVDLTKNPAHCGACNSPCPAGSLCQAGTCDVLCGAGQLVCDGVCTTVASDLSNCGACDTVCDAGLFCNSGVCSTTCDGIQCIADDGIECVNAQTNPSHCGGCGLACSPGFSCVEGSCALVCPEGLVACGELCVDPTSDALNCGFCGNSCGDQPCLGGQCGCGPGQTLCSGGCVDLATNRAHCGACGAACGDGASCVASACVCAAGDTSCAGACVDLQSNLAHCGACDQACAAGQVCNLGICSTTCGAGTVNCDGACVDVSTNRLNCGGCDNACPGALTCVGGACVCPSGSSLCGTDCFDLTRDVQHCGDCSTPCAGGQTCTGGVCSCPSGAQLCDGVCVDTDGNPQHCGGCGIICVDQQSCVGGTCECPSGQELCGEVCIDLQSSNENCGACGSPCAGGQLCVDGTCRCNDGMTGCGELCVDTQTSDEHCGGCDAPCPTGRSCVAGECAGVVGDGEDGCSGAAHSIELGKLSLYQAVEVPLMEDGAPIAAGARNADVVSQREALLRVHFTLGTEWVDREVSARLHLTTGGTEHTLYRRQLVSGDSNQGDLDSTIQIPVPAEQIGTDSRWWVEVVECEASLGPILASRFPDEGDVALEARATGSLKITYVPVQYLDGGTTWEPDTSSAALDLYADYLAAMYPATEIETGVTSSISTPAPLDFSALLDDVRAKRSADAAPDDVYYMGIIKPAANIRDYCGGSCTTGMGYVVDTTWGGASFRAAVSVAFGTESTASTIAHELGHNHGRDHAPCGVSGDANYPYTGGSIGSWGLDRRSDALQDPNQVADIMGYCSPAWVSDYTFQAFLERVATVNGVGAASLVSHGDARPWRVALVSPAGATWGAPIQDPRPPAGAAEAAQVVDATGRRIALVDVYVVRTSEPGYETVLVPEPQSTWYAIDLGSRGSLPFANP